MIRDCSGENSFSVSIDISEEIKNQIREYALSDLTRELGGVLVGNVTQSGDTYSVTVTDYIIAKYTDAHLSSVTFTADTWTDINKEMDAKYPDSKIVGWFHTHPGFGIFLSNWDLFIQQNFFNIPWQIAYVVDPCHKTDGFFIWENSEIIKISETVFTEPKQTEENHKETETEPKEKSLNPCFRQCEKINKCMSDHSKLMTWLMIVILALLVTVVILTKKDIIKSYYENINIGNILNYIKEYKTMLK